MLWMIMLACSTFQVVTVLRVGKEETSTDGATDAIWLLLRFELPLPRTTNVFAVMVWMLEARVAVTYRKVLKERKCKKEYITYYRYNFNYVIF